nr:hypothetical protein [Pseudoerythrocladia kornmannii]
MEDKLFRSNLQCNHVLNKLIQDWLSLGLIDEYLYQSQSFDKHIADAPKGCIIAPLLLNMFFYQLEHDLSLFDIKNNREKEGIKIIRHGFYFIILSYKNIIAFESLSFVQLWLNRYDIVLEDKSWDVCSAKKGVNFLNYEIVVNISLLLEARIQINPSKQAFILFVQINREEIQSLKSGPIKILIRRLHSRILDWGHYYANYMSIDVASELDKILFFQIRAILLRKHPRKSKNWIKKKYFPDSGHYYFANQFYTSSWIFTDVNLLTKEFLPKIIWLRKNKSYYN